jgi:cysteine synthase A
MLPDTGERYMTTPLFDDISEDMTTDEIEISKSTIRIRPSTTTALSPTSIRTPSLPRTTADSRNLPPGGQRASGGRSWFVIPG